MQPAAVCQLTDDAGLWVVGVDDHDALVAGVDVHQRALDVLLQLARVNVHLPRKNAVVVRRTTGTGQADGQEPGQGKRRPRTGTGQTTAKNRDRANDCQEPGQGKRLPRTGTGQMTAKNQVMA